MEPDAFGGYKLDGNIPWLNSYTAAPASDSDLDKRHHGSYRDFKKKLTTDAEISLFFYLKNKNMFKLSQYVPLTA